MTLTAGHTFNLGSTKVREDGGGIRLNPVGFFFCTKKKSYQVLSLLLGNLQAELRLRLREADCCQYVVVHCSFWDMALLGSYVIMLIEYNLGSCYH